MTPSSDNPTPDRVLSLDVIVNGAKTGTWLLVERAGQLHAPREAFEEWRVQKRADVPSIKFKGEDYWPLSAVPGYRSKIDFANQSVELLFSPEAFTATKLTQELYKRPVVSPVLPSVFFNYDLNYTDSTFRNAPSVKDLGMLSEFGISNRWGVFTNTGVGRNLTGNTVLGGEGRSWTRLETTFTRDYPEQNRTLRFGDTQTLPAMAGRAVYFGGVQYGTNFALTPGYISQPIPVLRGLSAEPSTVELYVNDVLRQVSNVPSGPFTVGNFPVVSGGGEVRVVVRDILGRETVLVQPFFTSTQLLAAGLSDWRVEAGSVRLDLGSASNRYGSGFVSGTWRHGYSDALTLEGRAEAASQLQTLWLGAATALPAQFLGKVDLVASHDQNLGNGNQWLLGLERQGVRSGMQIQAQGASIDFRALGQDATVLPTKLQIAGNATYTTAKAGTIGVGFARINQFVGVSVSTISANYSMRVGERLNLIMNASRAVAGASSNSFGVTLLIPMEKNVVTSMNAGIRGGQHDLYATASQSPPGDTGMGWRLLGGQQQDERRAEGGVYYQGRYGRVLSEISNTPDQTTVRLGASGGLVVADGHMFATRRVNDSFAVAEVAGYGDVGIGLGSNMLTRTDASGVALVPQLIAYQTNSVRLDPTELPVSAEIDSIEQFAVPAWRSAVKVIFPVRSGRGALLKIVLDDGDVAPAGATVQIEGDKQEFYVARRGEAFVTGLQSTNRLVLNWKDRQCRFDVTLPSATPDEVPRLGPLLCKGLAR
jgi:outer membrane usher protein